MAPGNPRPSDKSKTIKIVVGCLLLVFGALWSISYLLARPDIPAPPPDVPYVEPKPGPAKSRPDPGLAPRPIRLFHELVDAIRTQDKRTVTRFVELETRLVDVLVTPERAEIVNKAKAANSIEVAEPKIEGDKAVMVGLFNNGMRQPVMELAFHMARRGGDEDWKVTKVEDRWYVASGKQAESRRVALGEDRKGAEQVVKVESNFEKMNEVEPFQLGWIQGTTAEQKAEVEKYIKALLDDAHPAESASAGHALVRLGKPAVPMLLNQFIGLDVRQEGDVKRGYVIDRVMTRMAGVVVGYDVQSTGSSGVPPAMARQRAVRRWFGWWQDNKAVPLPARGGE